MDVVELVVAAGMGLGTLAASAVVGYRRIVGRLDTHASSVTAEFAKQIRSATPDAGEAEIIKHQTDVEVVLGELGRQLRAAQQPIVERLEVLEQTVGQIKGDVELLLHADSVVSRKLHEHSTELGRVRATTGTYEAVDPEP